MQANIVERRRELLKLRSLGVSLPDAVKELASKFDVSARTIYSDWEKRKDWIGLFLDIGDPEAFSLDILSNHRQIYSFAVKEYLSADNSSARIGALRLLRDLNLDLNELVTLNGLLERGKPVEDRGVEAPLGRGEVLRALHVVLDRVMEKVGQSGNSQGLERFSRIALQACAASGMVLRDEELDELKAELLPLKEDMNFLRGRRRK